ncbi:Crp/Fnr family transcriptional regulator [Stagnihabitans tardus]|uniref:Helix-turn-helix domain-containing protein n=1 Tax=Stagnihabitans tardus TaxID=2699202 RepID=A0AAE4YCC4_9RHOB|nr:Crp/Fnr family transcriptional regulator [Stagnihabitans tardus]NBZ89968.1 helix-turn-helix domain-containing protein [Stagnihabitans tardus]
MSFESFATMPRRVVPPGTVLFRPGDRAQGFVLVWRGRIEVRLTSPQGREILLYAVEPGQSCIQTTLGLLGEEAYSGEAVTRGEVELSVLPKAEFLAQMAEPGFRADVLRAFGQRMADLTRMLEIVAFERIDQRLARALLDLAEAGLVTATQSQLADRIGSAREVVTRQLQAFAEAGWIRTGRGQVEILDPAALAALV